MIQNKKLLYIALLFGFALFSFFSNNEPALSKDAPQTQTKAPTQTASLSTLSPITQAFNEKRSAVQVEGSGEVVQILKDDNDGSRHQRFILRLDSGESILIAHNIDLAPRIEKLQKGDIVAFYGVYEYNKKGGVVHWTHHDPRKKHISGWLKHKNSLYQ